MDCRDAAEDSEYSEDPLSAKQGTFFLKSICKDDIDQEYDGEDGSCDADCLVGHPAAQLSKQGLQDVKEDHAAYAETDAWVQGDPPFEVKGKPSVIPEPASGGELHDIASCKFHNGSDHNDPQEDQERSDQEFTDIDAFFLKPGQRKDKDQCPESINDAVWSEKYTPV